MTDGHDAFVSKAERKKKPDGVASGSAIAAGGAVTSGVGLAAGGVPGGKSDFTTVLNMKQGSGKGVKRAATAAARNRNAAKAAPGGILGFRTHAHQGGLAGFREMKDAAPPKKAKDAHDAFFRGRNAGKIGPEEKIIRHMTGAKRVANAALLGGAVATAYGVDRVRGGKYTKIHKSQRDADKFNGTLLGAGAAGAGISHGGSKVLGSQQHRWAKVATDKVDEAGRIAPRIAGREGKRMTLRQMHKHNTRNPGQPYPKTMYPSVTDSQIKRNPKLLKGVSPKNARKAGELRGAAAQARHFSEVYGNTEKVVRRFRGPSSIVAAAGAGGLAMSRKPERVKKMSDAEIRRRKKLQGHISVTTGTLGLASLGAFGAAKIPGSKVMAKTPKLRRIAAGVNTKKAETAALGFSTTGAGIGGAGSYNFAAYTNAESKKKKQLTPVKKSSGASAFGVEHD